MKSFRSNRKSVNDADCARVPVETTTLEINIKIDDLVLDERRLMLREIACTVALGKSRYIIYCTSFEQAFCEMIAVVAYVLPVDETWIQ